MANYLLAPTPRLAQKVTGDALQDEFTQLRELFTVDSAKLKQITDHFVHELEIGLSGQGGDIVCHYSLLSTCYNTG